ncbi:MAG: ABC transporter ATP-binding protein [Proteobacteria bacterium]|nr:ABC transporter ATP-binding protein [Pseudomonadota bacterium]
MSILARLLGFAYRYRGYTIAGYLCLLATIMLGLVQPMIFREVIDVGIGQQDTDHLLAMALALVAVNVVSSLAGFGMSYCNEYVSQRVAYDIRNALYDHLQRLSFAYHDRARTGELMSRVTSDVEHSRVFVGNGVLQIINTAVLYVAILSIMLSLDWWLSLVSLATLPFIAATAVMYGRRVHPMFRRVQRQWAHLTAVLQENITGVRVVKAFARENFEVTKFEDENQAFLERQVATSRLQAFVFDGFSKNVCKILGRAILLNIIVCSEFHCPFDQLQIGLSAKKDHAGIALQLQDLWNGVESFGGGSDFHVEQYNVERIFSEKK